jgi:hypothetical protein
MKDFKNEFTDMANLNQKLKYYKKYAGVLNKFKQEKITDNNQNLNQSHFESVNQSSIYECIMKKYEKLFYDLDIKYHKLIQGKMKPLDYDIKLHTKHPQSGFSISENEITDEFAKVKRDINYLGHNPKDNVSLYKQLNEKLLNIFKSHQPKINYVDDKPKSGKEMTVEDFFTKKKEEKKRVPIIEEKTIDNLHSQEYLVNLFEKVQRKKEEMNKEFQKIKLEMAKNQQVGGGATSTSTSTSQKESSKFTSVTPNISSMKFTEKSEKEQVKDESIFGNKSASSSNPIPSGNIFGNQGIGDKNKQDKKEDTSKTFVKPELPKKEEQKEELPNFMSGAKNLFSGTDKNINQKEPTSNIFGKGVESQNKDKDKQKEKIEQSKPNQATSGGFSGFTGFAQKPKEGDSEKEKIVGFTGFSQKPKEVEKKTPTDSKSDKPVEKSTTSSDKENKSLPQQTTQENKSPFSLLNQSASQTKEDQKSSQESSNSFFSFKGGNANPLASQTKDSNGGIFSNKPLAGNQEKPKSEIQPIKEQPKLESTTQPIKTQTIVKEPTKTETLPQQPQQSTTSPFNMSNLTISGSETKNTQKKQEEKKSEQATPSVIKPQEPTVQNNGQLLGNISALNINNNKESVKKESAPPSVNSGVSIGQPGNLLGQSIQSNQNVTTIKPNQTAFSNLSTNTSSFFNNSTNQQSTIVSPQSQNMQPQGFMSTSLNAAPIQPKLQQSNLNPTSTAPVLNLQNISLPSTNPTNIMEKPGFGAKPSLGGVNPLQSGYGSLSASIAKPQTVFGQGTSTSTNQSGFAAMSGQTSGFSGFANVGSNQNQGGFFNNSNSMQQTTMPSPAQSALSSGFGMMGMNTTNQQPPQQQQQSSGFGMMGMNTTNQQPPQQQQQSSGFGMMGMNNQQMTSFSGFGSNQNQNFGQGGFQNMNQQNSNVPNMQGGNKKIGESYDYF